MIGTFHPEDLMQKWFLRNLPKAREVLSTFDSLNILLNGFENYEKKLYREVRNVIMFLCLPSVSDGMKDGAIRRLTELESANGIFEIMNLPDAKFNAFKTRLANEDYIQSLSAATEIEVAFALVKKIGENNVELYPSIEGGRFSDISVEINNKKTYINPS